GAVFRAHDLELDREVAVKIIRPERALSPRAIDDFVKEARIIARLDHPHILPEYGLDKTQFAACPVYLVMKLAKGGTLFDKLQEGALQPEEALRILRQVSEGLDYAHNQGVVHLDLKPHNILFDDRGNVLVGDFGLAKLLESATHVKADTGVGTSAYMPPEQFTGSNAGRFSDVFALGLTLHEMLTGHLPDRDYDPDRQQEYIVVDPSLPERVAHVIRKATERNPTQRYQTAGQLVEAFAAALKQPVTAEDPISTADESHLLETILHRLEQECVLRGIKTTSKEERGAFFRVRITDHQSEVCVSRT
ncbi:MAG: serine/threonine-protein kinase, partial [Ktedonobacterales bacterium]